LARAWRIQFEGAYYHVLSRGNESKEIFTNDRDRKLFLTTLGDAAERLKLEVLQGQGVLLRWHALPRDLG
jgi:putative transposase